MESWWGEILEDNLLQDEILQDSPSHEKVLQHDLLQNDLLQSDLLQSDLLQNDLLLNDLLQNDLLQNDLLQYDLSQNKLLQDDRLSDGRLQNVKLDDEPLRQADALCRRPGSIGPSLLRIDGEPGHYDTVDDICARWDDGMHIYPTDPPTGSAMWMFGRWVTRCSRIKYTIRNLQTTGHCIPRQTTTVRRKAFSDPIVREMLNTAISSTGQPWTLRPTRNRIPGQTATVRRRAFSDSKTCEIFNIAASSTGQLWIHVEFDPISPFASTSPAVQTQGTKRRRSSEADQGDEEMAAQAKRSKVDTPRDSEDNYHPERLALSSEEHTNRAEDSPGPS
ncbi:MAG: hypothetical protein Q9228_002067 [Teloschistes exilis]